MHKIARHDEAPGRLYMQNHGGFPEHPDFGVLRSDDYGSSWRSIAKGLPSDFGFPIVVHPQNADTVYAVDNTQFSKTTNAGASWETETSLDLVGASNMMSLWSARRELINRELKRALVHGTGSTIAQYGVACVLEHQD